MPKLKQSNEGTYYTHAFVGHGRPPATYQVAREAVQRLAIYGVEANDDIPRNLFNELKEEGLIYTGGSGLSDDYSGYEPDDGSGNRLDPKVLAAMQLEETQLQRSLINSKLTLDDLIKDILLLAAKPETRIAIETKVQNLSKKAAENPEWVDYFNSKLKSEFITRFLQLVLNNTRMFFTAARMFDKFIRSDDSFETVAMAYIEAFS